MNKQGQRPYVIQMVEARHGEVPFERLVQERREQGQTFCQIARDFGISRQTVWRYRGKPAPRPGSVVGP